MVRFSDVLTIVNGRNQKNVENKNGQYPIYGSGGIMGYADKYLCEADTVIIGRKGSINNPIYVKEPFWNVDTAFGLVADKTVLLPKYLYYFCVKFDFNALNTTVTIPSLTKANLLNIEMVLPTIEEQTIVVNSLDKIVNIIDMRKQQLQKLDELVKARFVEMFGNVGMDVKNWGMSKLGDVCEVNPKKVDDGRLKDELEISFIPMSSVSENGEIIASEIKTVEEVKSGFTYFAEGDVIFAKITPCMENGKGAVARGLKNGIAFGSTEFHVLRPIIGKSNSYWIYYVTSFEKFRGEAEANMTGSAGQRRVPISFLENYKVSVPPIELQNNFADFVQQVDKSKLSVQQSLEKLETLKKALMQKYFG